MAITFLSDDSKAFYNRACVCRFLGRDVDALDDGAKAWEIAEEDLACVPRGPGSLMHFQNGDYMAAQDSFDAAAKSFAASPDATYHHGLASTRLGNHTAAGSDFQKCHRTERAISAHPPGAEEFRRHLAEPRSGTKGSAGRLCAGRTGHSRQGLPQSGCRSAEVGTQRLGQQTQVAVHPSGLPE